MSVSTFDPKKSNPVTFTPKAIEHLEKQVQSQNAKGIQFEVKESGCSGFKYLLELTFETSVDDLSFQLSEKLSLYIAPKVVPLIKGTQVDYIQEGLNNRLDFNNPNATAICGCGESFTVEQQ